MLQKSGQKPSKSHALPCDIPFEGLLSPQLPRASVSPQAGRADFREGADAAWRTAGWAQGRAGPGASLVPVASAQPAPLGAGLARRNDGFRGYP